MPYARSDLHIPALHLARLRDRRTQVISKNPGILICTPRSLESQTDKAILDAANLVEVRRGSLSSGRRRAMLHAVTSHATWRPTHLPSVPADARREQGAHPGNLEAHRRTAHLLYYVRPPESTPILATLPRPAAGVLSPRHVARHFDAQLTTSARDVSQMAPPPLR